MKRFALVDRECLPSLQGEELSNLVTYLEKMYQNAAHKGRPYRVVFYGHDPAKRLDGASQMLAGTLLILSNLATSGFFSWGCVGFGWFLLILGFGNVASKTGGFWRDSGAVRDEET